MTRLRALQATLAVLVAVMIWSWTRTPQGTVRPPTRRPPPPARGATLATAGPLEADAQLTRNLFQYGAAPVTARTAAPVLPTPMETPVALATAGAPVKLVGLVQQDGGLRAALAIEGDIVLGSRGQSVGGYTIVSIDEDRGVVLNDPDGRTIELRREEPR